MFCCCCAVTWGIVAVAAFFLYKWFFKGKKEPEIQVKSWEKDVVYLFQFPRPKCAPNLSPFCVKLEAFLRANNIKHEIKETVWTRSRYGLLPFIELNGKHYGDSQLIDFVLRDHFKVKDYPSGYDQAVGRAVDRLISSFTFGIINKFKALDHMDEFAPLLIGVMQVPAFLSPILANLLPFFFKGKFQKRINAIVGPFSDDEYRMLFRKDMSAVQEILGNKKFLFGDKITSTDCTLFGQLAVVYYLPYPNEVQRILREEFKPIIEYLERFRHELFPDDFSR